MSIQSNYICVSYLVKILQLIPSITESFPPIAGNFVKLLELRILRQVLNKFIELNHLAMSPYIIDGVTTYADTFSNLSKRQSKVTEYNCCTFIIL